jgi:hypothetical protein
LESLWPHLVVAAVAGVGVGPVGVPVGDLLLWFLLLVLLLWALFLLGVLFLVLLSVLVW